MSEENDLQKYHRSVSVDCIEICHILNSKEASSVELVRIPKKQERIIMQGNHH